MSRSLIFTLPLFFIWACGGASQPKESTTSNKAKSENPSQQEQASQEQAPQTQASPITLEDHNSDQKLKAAILSPERSEKEKARDVYRHPYETLAFFQVHHDMTVLELWPGGGWYTHILGPYLKDDGKLIAANMDAEGSHPRRKEYAQNFLNHLEEKKEMLGPIETVVLSPPNKVTSVPSGSVDRVLTFRNSHNWQKDGVLEATMSYAFDALKPGGVFGVVQHRANEGADPNESAKKGYLPQSYVIQKAIEAGFVLDGQSEINANPKDTKNYENGVWELPPSLRAKEENKQKHLGIGESDRMTLRFVKPSQP